MPAAISLDTGVFFRRSDANEDYYELILTGDGRPPSDDGSNVHSCTGMFGPEWTEVATKALSCGDAQELWTCMLETIITDHVRLVS